MYLAVWEFEVRRGREAQFARLYGPEGEWVRLFRRAAGYLETRVAGRGRRFITVDCWRSRAAYLSFRRRFAARHAALDRRGEVLTVRETPLHEATAPGAAFRLAATRARARGSSA